MIVIRIESIARILNALLKVPILIISLIMITSLVTFNPVKTVVASTANSEKINTGKPDFFENTAIINDINADAAIIIIGIISFKSLKFIIYCFIL